MPKSTTKKSSSSKENDAPSITPIKTSECPTLTGKSTLTYQIGHNQEKALFIRIIGNTGGGYFGKDWVAIEDIFIQLEQCPELITSTTIAGLFHRRSANNAGFTLAVLLSEKIIQPSKEKRRCFVLQPTQPFLDAMEKLQKATGPMKKAAVKKKTPPSKNNS